jgi:hypothetical protein
MNKKIILASIIALGMGACQDKSQEEALKKAHDEVLALHDSAMALNGKVNSLRDTLQKIAQNPAVSAQMKTQADSLSRVLGLADKKMFDWMHDYNIDFAEGKKVEEALKYEQDNIKQMTDIDKLTKESVAAGKRLLGEKE